MRCSSSWSTDRIARLVGLLGYGVLAGLVGTTVLHGWLGVLPGAPLLDAAAIGLFALATAGTVTGLGTLLGRAGLGLAALLVFLVGNPLSAVGAAPELLPQPWGTLGQWLPVGAGGSLLRSTSFFDGAGAARPLAVLLGYLALALLLTLLPPRAVRKGPCYRIRLYKGPFLTLGAVREDGRRGSSEARAALCPSDRVRAAARWIDRPVPLRQDPDQSGDALGRRHPGADRARPGGTAADGDEPAPAKLVTKLVFGLMIFVMVYFSRRRESVNRGHFLAIVALTLVNAAVAVFWR